MKEKTEAIVNFYIDFFCCLHICYHQFLLLLFVVVVVVNKGFYYQFIR